MALEESFAGCLAERSVKSRIFNILCNQLCIFKSLADLTCLCFGLLLPFLRAIDKLLTLFCICLGSEHSWIFAPNVLKVCRTLPSP
ncbi:hypothetical protein YC2023_030196 [Brassica napus]